MKDIEEMIADAKAEEQVAKEQAIENSNNDFREELRAKLKDMFSTNADNKVSLSLNEYLILKFKERDLETITSAIISNLTLGYDGESLRLNHKNDVVDVIKVIYPDMYETILEDLQQKEGE